MAFEVISNYFVGSRKCIHFVTKALKFNKMFLVSNSFFNIKIQSLKTQQLITKYTLFNNIIYYYYI